MQFLLTNDDGIDAPGLNALCEAVSDLGECVVAAPDQPHSGASHRVTDARSIAAQERSAGRFALSGTPVDCTRIGVRHLAPDAEWVFAGINAGANLGTDVFMSGTVAAAREAALCGRKAIAFSHYRHWPESPWDWTSCVRWTREVLAQLLTEPLAAGEFWNVNFPHLPPEGGEPEVVFCPVDLAHFELQYEPVENSFVYRDVYQQRPRTPGRDVDVCFGGKISVSKLTVSSNAG